MKKIVLISLAILTAVPSWGQTGVYKKRDTAPQDGTITTSITKKRTNIEIQEIEKKPKEYFRRGWQIEAELPAVMFLSHDYYDSYPKSISPRVSVGYLFNHWYLGLFAGYNSCSFGHVDYMQDADFTQTHAHEFLVFGINGRYYFGKGKWTPFVGIRVGGLIDQNSYSYHVFYYDGRYDDNFNYDDRDLGLYFGVDAGIKCYLNKHFAIGLYLPFDTYHVAYPNIGIGVGVSYLF